MNKKIFIGLIVSASIIVSVIIGVNYVINGKDTECKVIESGYVSDFEDKVISTYDEYMEFCEYAKDEDFNAEYSCYNKSYFNKKSLAVLFYSIHPDDEFNGISSLKLGNTLYVKPEIEYSNSPTTVISGVVVMIEVNKNITTLK